MAKHRKTHRRRRHTKRRSAKRSHRMMYGGAPANVGQYNMGMKSLPAGMQFLNMHEGQHGGAAPIASTGQLLLPSSLNDSARVGATYAQYGQIAGLSDQTGGRRRRHRRSHSGKKTHRRSRKMRGGALMLTPAEVGWKEAVAVPQGVNPQFASWDASA